MGSSVRGRLSKHPEPEDVQPKTPAGPINSEYRPGLITPERLHRWALTVLPYYIEAYEEAKRYNRWYRRALRWVWNLWSVMQVRIGVRLLWLQTTQWMRDIFYTTSMGGGEPTVVPREGILDPATTPKTEKFDSAIPADPDGAPNMPPRGAPTVELG